MLHPFSELAAEYTHLLSIMQVTKPQSVDVVARSLLSHKPRYEPVCAATGVPLVVLATLHERESSADFNTYLGNGEPLNRITRLVPKGRGPFPTWEAGAIDGINYDHLNDNSAPWTMPYACWKGEAWNGFGPRNHGKHTGYLWSGTNVYTGGKYVSDGVWDPNFMDPQLGIVPVMLRMIALDPSLALGATNPMPTPVIPIAPVPVGVGGGTTHDAKWIQQSLNKLGFGPLLEDGNFGRRSREAARAFQASKGLTADGLVGPQTITTLEKALMEKTNG